MKVLLIKDVYKLGRAGEIKKVAAGYGRNYLIPQGMAIPALPGSTEQAERIRVKATERRAALNEELADVAEVLNGKVITFPVKAGETGRLYGSVSDEEIIKAIQVSYEIELEKRQIETEPIRQLGTYTVPIHLTMDLVPELTVIVHREGEPPVHEADQEPEAETASPVVEQSEIVEETEEMQDMDDSETDIEEELDEVLDMDDSETDIEEEELDEKPEETAEGEAEQPEA
jgi:large subunit ribosomal protein L9